MHARAAGHVAAEAHVELEENDSTWRLARGGGCHLVVRVADTGNVLQKGLDLPPLKWRQAEASVVIGLRYERGGSSSLSLYYGYGTSTVRR